jgi:hypothetical protein
LAPPRKVTHLSRSAGRASQAAVNLAADEILASGRQPTLLKLRAAVGGDPRELRAMLESWARQVRSESMVDRSELANELLDIATHDARNGAVLRARTQREEAKADESRSSTDRLGRISDLEAELARQAARIESLSVRHDSNVRAARRSATHSRRRPRDSHAFSTP